MPRPAKKKTEVLSEAQETGRLRAQKKFSKTEPFLDKLKPYLMQILHRIDPLEAIAIFGTTIIIKQGINWTEDMFKDVNVTWLMRFILSPVGAAGQYSFEFVNEILKKGQAGSLSADETKTLKDLLGTPQAEILQWLVSFSAAYIIVHHFGAIVEAGSNVVGMAKGLLFAAAA